jgi:hypothetical protein
MSERHLTHGQFSKAIEALDVLIQHYGYENMLRALKTWARTRGKRNPLRKEGDDDEPITGS